MGNRKVVVFSVDAMVAEDIDYLLEEDPAFAALYATGSSVRTVRSVWPSVTYACHTTMSTGAWPAKHGVYNNMAFTPGQLKNIPWNFFADNIKCTDIFTQAKRAGLTTADVFWPVTARHAFVDYSFPEYWPPDPNTPYDECFPKVGTSREVWDSCIAPYNNGVKIRTHPGTDEMLIQVSCAMIRNYRPDLLMIHVGDLDTFRHRYGIFSDWTKRGSRDASRWLFDLIAATKEAGVYEDTDFFLTSDHGQLNIVRSVNPNVILADNGLIDVAPDGSLAGWKAYVHSAGLSAQVRLSDPSDRAVWEKTYTVLKHMRDEGIYGISEVLTAEEALEKEHLAGPFSFVLETDGYSSFSEDWRRPIVRPLDLSDYRRGRATHGHHPDKGPQPVFFGFGPDIRAGVRLDRRLLIDEAPTYARCLGIDLPDAEGHAIDEFFN